MVALKNIVENLKTTISTKATTGESASFSDLTVNGLNYKKFGAESEYYTDIVHVDSATIKANQYVYYIAPADGFLSVRAENFYWMWADGDLGTDKYKVLFDTPKSTSPKVLEVVAPVYKGQNIRINLDNKADGDNGMYIRFTPLKQQE